MKKYITVAALVLASILILAATAFKLVAADATTTPPLVERPKAGSDLNNTLVIVPVQVHFNNTEIKLEISHDLETWAPVTNGISAKSGLYYLRIVKSERAIRF